MKAFREMVLRAWDLCVNDIVLILNTSSVFSLNTAEITMPHIPIKRKKNRVQRVDLKTIKFTIYKLVIKWPLTTSVGRGPTSL